MNQKPQQATATPKQNLQIENSVTTGASYKHSKSNNNFLNPESTQNTANSNLFKSKTQSTNDLSLLNASTKLSGSSSFSIEPKIKIKRKKTKPNGKKSEYSLIEDQSEKDVFDMIEKVQSNGFDDQRYKHSLASSSVSILYYLRPRKQN